MVEPTQNGRKVRSVDQYLRMLELSGRSQFTLRNYRAVLVSYSKFLDVPLDEVHNHLSADNLIRYAASRKDRAKSGRKTSLSVLHRYMTLNGVQFDALETGVVKVAADEDRTDKPLTPDILQKMMDQGNTHSRAILSFLISTGCRAGEASKILLSDVNGDIVTIRNDLAKRRKGGTVFLTSEAREFLDVWLKDRPAYIKKANELTRQLYAASTHHQKVPRKDTGKQQERPEDDQRLFACSYSTIDKIFGRLYRSVDGERGKYRAKVTAHSCRAYFRTRAPKGMSIDLVEGLLRHTGYLNAQYVRSTPEERYKEFKAGEHVLFITRPDHRNQAKEVEQIKRENEGKIADMAAQLRDMQRQLDLLKQFAPK